MDVIESAKYAIKICKSCIFIYLKSAIFALSFYVKSANNALKNVVVGANNAPYFSL